MSMGVPPTQELTTSLTPENVDQVQAAIQQFLNGEYFDIRRVDPVTGHSSSWEEGESLVGRGVHILPNVQILAIDCKSSIYHLPIGGGKDPSDEFHWPLVEISGDLLKITFRPSPEYLNRWEFRIRS